MLLQPLVPDARAMSISARSVGSEARLAAGELELHGGGTRTRTRVQMLITMAVETGPGRESHGSTWCDHTVSFALLVISFVPNEDDDDEGEGCSSSSYP